MAVNTTTYYVVSPATGDATSPDTLCERTYQVIVAYDTVSHVYTLLKANFCQGYFNLWNDYVQDAALQTFSTLPAPVKAWCTQFSYNNLSFDVYA